MSDTSRFLSEVGSDVMPSEGGWCAEVCSEGHSCHYTVALLW